MAKPDCTMRASLTAVLVVLLIGCPPESTPPPAPTPPPSVFLNIGESTIIGSQIEGNVSVSGCNAVTQVQILEGDTFLADAKYQTSPMNFVLPASLFNARWGTLGFAASLTLRAKVICDDGRSNTSQPRGISFLPVEKTAPLAMPQSFVAEGGIGGTPVTFIGCAGLVDNGLNINALARFGTDGDLKASNTELSPCTDSLVISPRNLATGTRWVMQPGQFAALVRMSDFKIVKRVGLGSVSVSGIARTIPLLGGTDMKALRLGVGKDGSAVLFSDDVIKPFICYITPVENDSSSDWCTEFPETMNSDPLVDSASGVVWTSSWQFRSGNPATGNTVLLKYQLRSVPGGATAGDLLSGAPIIKGQQFGLINTPIVPEATFSANGSLLYLPFLSEANNIISTTILACPTQVAGCMGAVSISKTVPGVIDNIIPFAGGVAALGRYQILFLTDRGVVRNLSEQPLRPSGNSIFKSAQPGLGSDFYAFAGPNNGSVFPSEIVATDKPESGELWRVSYGTGENALASFSFAVDEAGRAWMRMGTHQVKPLSNTEYRTFRGPTILQP
jgi:hypothetical protein